MATVEKAESAMADDAWASVFPLPLNSFEQFMLADGRTAFPMMCELEAHLLGRIERAAFDAALALAMERAPLFRAVVRQEANGKHVWIPTDFPIEVDWAPIDAPLGPRYDEPVDLTSEPGLRIWVREGAERSTVLLHFHHACSDGIGGFAFFEDLFAAYANQLTDTPQIALRPLDPQLLPTRAAPPDASISFWQGLKHAVIGVREGWKFFWQRPLSLPEVNQTDSAAPIRRQRDRSITRHLSEATTIGLRHAASRLQASVNDLLLRDLFLTLNAWCEEYGQSTRGRRLRILMPQNLRRREDRAMPVANAVGFAFLTRRARDLAAPNQLLKSIGEETEAVRKGELSRYFLGGLDSMISLGLLSRLLRSRFCFSTVVLTNLGDPVRRFTAKFPRNRDGLAVGPLTLLGMTGVPPLRPGTRGAFCIFNSAHALSISLRTDPYGCDAADTERLLDAYIARLDATAMAGNDTGE